VGPAARVSGVSSQPSGPGFETTAERKRHRRQLTEDGNGEMSRRGLRERSRDSALFLGLARAEMADNRSKANYKAFIGNVESTLKRMFD
jgi:hypothetical protein